ncbi:carotenoid biosynthesis protein [Motilibacter aurantiacus]|uniref:carotenoid biosynthesis protein n=1 Tax=Motilibacter aurantiacus TaxID=2714955 RepID=UPI001408F1B9|nr:carotenoid biosynthesis protein [Motilibacter aurantiacus]NHC45585.1 carotenoid biosynthesis protein [Motilibacter aurantiacus]
MSTSRAAATPRALPRQLPAVLAAAAIGCQIAYPLVEGTARNRLTVVTVVVFLAAVLAHAAATRGPAWAGAYFAVAAGTGLSAEALGVATGFPFGEYDYRGTLGAKLLGVPVVIPLAWAMFTYPALLVGRRLSAGRAWAAVGIGALALASWDLFLDPQMVDAGHWRWADPDPALPGIPEIPVSNFAGWLLVALVLMTLLRLLLPDRPGPEGVPATLYLWTYASSVLAAAAFFGRPTVALVGGIGMGVVAVPYAHALLRDR